MQYKIEVERKHTLNGHVKRKTCTVEVDAESLQEAEREAIKDLTGMQLQLAYFGDTGMDDGQYLLQAISATDADGNKYKPEGKTDWKMVYP